MLNFRVEDDSIMVTELHVTDHDEVSRCVYVGDTVYAVCYVDDAAHLESFRYH